MLFSGGFEIGNIDVAVLIALRHHDLHTAHLCAGWVGAVCAGRDQTDVAMRFTTTCVITTNRE